MKNYCKRIKEFQYSNPDKVLNLVININKYGNQTYKIDGFSRIVKTNILYQKKML